MFPSPRLTRTLLTLLGVGCVPLALFGQANTTPVGFTTVTVPAAVDANTPSNATLAVPLYNTPDFSGLVATVDSTTQFTFSNATFSSADVYATAAAPRFVRVKTSATTAHVGRFFLVAHNTTGGQLTVSLPSGTSDIATAVSVGDVCEIVPANTLGTLFGATPVGFLTGSAAASADNVLIWNGSTWDTYFNSGTSWKKPATFGSQNNVIIYPDEGLFIIRRDPSGPLNLTLMGTVPSTSEQSALAGAGSTFVANRLPVDTTLGTLALQNTTGWTTGSSAANADNVFLWNGSTWDTYFHDGTSWKKPASFGSKDTTPILANTAIFITRHGGQASVVTQALTYTP